MTDKHNTQAGKTVDDGYKAANTVQNDPKGNSRTMHKDAEMKTEQKSGNDKSGARNEVCADPKCSCHDMNKDTQKKVEHVSGNDKTGTHNTVSADPKFKDHNMHKDAELKTEHVSGHDKSSAHNGGSADAKPAAHNMTEIHAQISGALAGAKFPVKTPADLISAFPDGASTKCHSGDLTMTAGEAGKLLRATDYPFASAKAVADLIVQRASL